MNKLEQLIKRSQQAYSGELKTALWITFWLFILTWGDNDLIGALVNLINKFAT